MDPEEIKKCISEIRKSKLNEKQIRSKYYNFAEECPRLFEFAIDKTNDLKYLEPMFYQLEMIKNSKIDLNTADSNIYNILKKDFIPKDYQ